ncbi:MAG: NADH-quinone oxidoreductase subunit NuoB [Anaerolineae bacterium]|jgi:NADH-quinone oxidoreductase B subunit|nr:NADH-quinone oxidoreductase subunit NuoB [Anaerolineae bacterium]
MIQRLFRLAHKKSPWILTYNAGGCNGCDIELLGLFNPRYDIERFGILQQASPRHADILICTGPVTIKTRPYLERIYEQIPSPKHVLVVGSCGCTGGIFKNAYNVLGGIDQVIPVDLYLPGCPCRPEAIFNAVQTLIDRL